MSSKGFLCILFGLFLVIGAAELFGAVIACYTFVGCPFLLGFGQAVLGDFKDSSYLAKSREKSSSNRKKDKREQKQITPLESSDFPVIQRFEKLKNLEPSLSPESVAKLVTLNESIKRGQASLQQVKQAGIDTTSVERDFTDLLTSVDIVLNDIEADYVSKHRDVMIVESNLLKEKYGA